MYKRRLYDNEAHSIQRNSTWGVLGFGKWEMGWLLFYSLHIHEIRGGG